jgi:U4/U6.U5 tri-snRNP-associated protein 1
MMQPVRSANHGSAEDDDNINVDGRRDDGTLVFNSTTEFSTRLQAHLNEKARAKTEALMRGLERDSAAAAPASGSKRPHAQQDMAVDEDDDSDVSQERKTGEKKAEAADISGTMEDFAGVSDMDDSDMEVDEDEEDGEAGDEIGDEQLDFVHRQPLVGKGMAATLALLKGSGELKKVEQLAGRAKDSRQYDPSATDHGIKLEYRDEFGRKLTQKEAFRQLSYKFHGYGPSQKKKEKRLKVSCDTCICKYGTACSGGGGFLRGC